MHIQDLMVLLKIIFCTEALSKQAQENSDSDRRNGVVLPDAGVSQKSFLMNDTSVVSPKQRGRPRYDQNGNSGAEAMLLMMRRVCCAARDRSRPLAVVIINGRVVAIGAMT